MRVLELRIICVARAPRPNKVRGREWLRSRQSKGLAIALVPACRLSVKQQICHEFRDHEVGYGFDTY
jgi:hypothetical protein